MAKSRTSSLLGGLGMASLCVCGGPAVQGAAAGAAGSPAVVETRHVRLGLTASTGAYTIADRRSGVVWRSNPYRPRLGEATFEGEGQPQKADLAACTVRQAGRALEAEFHPLPARPDLPLRVRLEALGDGQTVEFSYAAAPDLKVRSVRLLDDAFPVSGADAGYIVVPVREGLLIPADSGAAFTRTFDTYAYEGCHMAMVGVVQQGSAALVSWEDPYVAAEVRREPAKAGEAPDRQVLSLSLTLRHEARSARVRFLGRGDYVTIGEAYRELAQQRGWRVPWSRKLKENPARAGLLGAVNYKLWSVLSRQMNEESTREESVRLSWTFDEAAQVAEHLKRDLKLERVLFGMGGWIRRGYDNQHPDILPAAPECGGNPGLADAARRIMALGYVLALHDNYQDLYKDSPSWDESLLMRTRDGKLAVGGHWAGGRAYLTCSRRALDLARRPNNLPAVQILTRANAYFIDTTYAAGLQECFDPQHPLTRADDLKWKQALSRYARELFGIFGSECGREWAIPCSDFFEGLTGVSGQPYHDTGLLKQTGGVPVPLFEVVYRDCIAMHGKYGYKPETAAPFVLQHLAWGRPLHYHHIPAHLYWTNLPGPAASVSAPPPEPDPGLFVRGDRGWTEGLHPLDRFVKNTYEISSPLYELTAQMRLTRHEFLTPDRKAQRTVFGAGHAAVEAIMNASTNDLPWASRFGGPVVLPPNGFLIEGPAFVAFHARRWQGLSYDAPPLFTLRAVGGLSLATAPRARVFHGFGDPRIRWAGRELTVEREAVVSRRQEK